MLAGWFLLLSSCVGFYRVKRWEASIRASSAPEEAATPEQRAYDEQVRRNIELAFGFGDPGDEDEDGDEDARTQAQAHVRRGSGDGNGDENAHRRMAELSEAELRLTRTLQAAGLL